MNWSEIFLWGFVATLILTTTGSGSMALGLTRMDIPFMLGTIVTSNRDRAKVIGFFMHFTNGWIFAFFYALLFRSLGLATWWLGALFGLLHAAVVLVAFLPVLPSVHPRMVSDYSGPEPTRLLEPPGILALNYGYRTPLAVVVSHLLYGGILGAAFAIN